MVMIMKNAACATLFLISVQSIVELLIIRSELITKGCKALGRLGGKFQILARDGMDKTELAGVQTLTVQRRDDL